MKTALKSAVVFPQMVELRRTFPRYPELAFEEKGHWFRTWGKSIKCPQGKVFRYRG